MDRAIPVAGNKEIDLYVRTFYSLLRSSSPIRVRSLEETHAGMNSSLHTLADDETRPDIGAFSYAYLRLPSVVIEAERIILAQSEEVFERKGYRRVDQWQIVEAPARRRKLFYDAEKRTLAAFIASVSDIDDLIPTIVTFQIEWNKMHRMLHAAGLAAELQTQQGKLNKPTLKKVQQALGLEADAWKQAQRLFGADAGAVLATLATTPKDLSIHLLASSVTDYRRATQGWWDTIETHADRTHLPYRPAYFVSSNLHSLVNLLTGYAWQGPHNLRELLAAQNPESLWDIYQALEAADSDHPERYNLLYYAQRFAEPNITAARSWELESGIQQIENPLYLDVGVQIIDMARLRPERFDPRLRMDGIERLQRSNAIIFNIDYPLGMAAYNLLSQVMTSIGSIRGVYIIGKAATLNARVGDVMIPNVVYDEHSLNTFLFRNAFNAQSVAPYLLYHDVFDNQKAVTVRGTFLQNQEFMGLFHDEGYTDIEMEAGPYLSAVYENIYPQRYPINEIVNLFINAHYDIGILHYASDTPYSKRKALLSESLSYRGVDATYACTIAVLRRIFATELARG